MLTISHGRKQTMLICVRPVGKGQFLAWSDADWVWGCPTSSQPLVDVARQALANGIDPDEPIEMWHGGAETWALRSTVGGAAGLRVDEDGPRFRKWEPSTEIRRRFSRGAKA